MTNLLEEKLMILKLIQEKNLPVEEGFAAIEVDFQGEYTNPLVIRLKSEYDEAQAQFRYNWWHTRLMEHFNEEELVRLLNTNGREFGLPDEHKHNPLLWVKAKCIERRWTE